MNPFSLCLSSVSGNKVCREVIACGYVTERFIFRRMIALFLDFFCPLKYNKQKPCHIISKKQNIYVFPGRLFSHFLKKVGNL